MSEIRIDGQTQDPVFIFAHGAGAGMEHAFMQAVAAGLAQKGVQVVRFNFPYMVKRAQDGKKRPPDRAPKLLEAYTEVIEQFAQQGPIVIGGKSMGGRMASLLADHPNVAGVACLGFPFHPPGKPENYKGDHLAQLSKPCLILQGERDTFGKREEFAEFTLSEQVITAFLPDGDHSFKPRKASGHTEAGNIDRVIEQLAAFILEVYHGAK
ncbi:alpha/beta fold hydrolase [Vibrio sp. JPW-9-11-11]|uniref:alpha/beta fold hydrolase n=1 Tax=Vibrio sp. JPW-9-11-11 TaxID=1416532 RepID=UPI001593472F|nr:alpha/beta fold hydrolase [Vibrio sp. JPW-9-11-11]NVD06102.1 alpha/beta fold hydrolase [Vibrio sp. JPW-9-11-11]